MADDKKTGVKLLPVLREHFSDISTETRDRGPTRQLTQYQSGTLGPSCRDLPTSHDHGPPSQYNLHLDDETNTKPTKSAMLPVPIYRECNSSAGALYVQLGVLLDLYP